MLTKKKEERETFRPKKKGGSRKLDSKLAKNKNNKYKPTVLRKRSKSDDDEEFIEIEPKKFKLIVDDDEDLDEIRPKLIRSDDDDEKLIEIKPRSIKVDNLLSAIRNTPELLSKLK